MTKNLTTFLASVGIGFLVGTFFYVSERNRDAYSKPTKVYKRKLGSSCNYHNDCDSSESYIVTEEHETELIVKKEEESIVTKEYETEMIVKKEEDPKQENSSTWATGLGDYI